jgi:integrase
LRVIEIPQSKTGTVKRLQIATSVWDRMKELETYSRGEYILPGKHKTAREDLAKREFSQAMRSLGYHPAKFTKTGHVLRRVVGSEILTSHDLETAQAYLGHRSRQTTERSYARLLAPPQTIEIPAPA